MQRWMPSVRVRPRPPPSAALARGGVPPSAARGLLPGAVAAADEPAGTTVVGRLVQAWAEGSPRTTRTTADGPISWVQTAAGDAVRVPTEDVEDIPAGATVEVTVGPRGRRGRRGPAARGRSPPRSSPRPAVDPVLRTASGRHQPGHRRPASRPPACAPDAVTAQQLVDVVDGPVADFWSEQSNGAITVGVTAAARLGRTPSPAAPTRRACGTRSPPRSASSPAPAST